MQKSEEGGPTGHLGWLLPPSLAAQAGPREWVSWNFPPRQMSHLDCTILPPPYSQPGALFLEKEGKTGRRSCSWGPTLQLMCGSQPPLRPFLCARARGLKASFISLFNFIIIKNSFYESVSVTYACIKKIHSQNIYHRKSFFFVYFVFQPPVTL